MTVRTRFAPSPTGYLHVGGVRTALFSWLHARRHGGTFVLRIEDTDLERSTAESVNAILEGMTWLGLSYDEGPLYQTERFERYDEAIEKLLREGKAYRCDCPKERLDVLRAKQMERREKPKYDGRCRSRDIDPEQPHVIRFRTPDEGRIAFDDLIRGSVVWDNAELDDLVIRKSDGAPTYNLAVVVDDLDMRISHVIRGEDHVSNTPRQAHIFRALGAEVPVFAHVPMILGDDGSRLSKRHGAVGVMQYREEGFLPEALLNYLVRLGWSHGDQELFTVDEMIQLFELEAVNKAASTFDNDKLLWLNQHYITTGDPAHLAGELSWHLGRLGIDPTDGPDLVEVVRAQQGRAKTLVEMAEISAFFYRDPLEYDGKAARKHFKPAASEPLGKVRAVLAELDPWAPEALHDLVAATADSLAVGMGKVAQPLRVAVSGRAATPGIDVTLHLVGREATLRRIDRALEFIREQAEATE